MDEIKCLIHLKSQRLIDAYEEAKALHEESSEYYYDGNEPPPLQRVSSGSCNIDHGTVSYETLKVSELWSVEYKGQIYQQDSTLPGKIVVTITEVP